MYKELEAYAMEHYEQGGHWVVESFDKSDYDKYIVLGGGDIAGAKAKLKWFWELKEEICQDIRGHGGCNDGDY